MKSKQPEKGEKNEKGERGGFMGFLIGGLIMVLIGFIALVNIYTHWLTGGTAVALLLLVIGVIVIIAAVYFSTMARKRYPPA